MRHEADATRVRALARDLGRHAGQRVRLYLTGGATAVLVGWRSSTVDVDLRIEPEDEAVLRRLPQAKEAVDVNIELFTRIEPELLRYPAIDPPAFRRRVEGFAR